jgi:hypothetical protein
MDVVVPCPDRIRQIPANFGWIDRGFRDQRFLGTMTLKELAVYVFLVLAANKHGVSFYRSEQIAALFDYQLQPLEVIQCRNALFDKGLISFQPFSGHSREGFYQVLPLPKSVSPFIPSQRCGDVSSLHEILDSLNFGR